MLTRSHHGRIAALALATAAGAAIISAAPAAHAGPLNVVSNPGFETPGPSTFTTFTGVGSGGLSAAAQWAVFNNGSGTTTTDLLPVSTLPGGAAHMLHVTTDLNDSGIVNAGFLVPAGVPVTCSAWVYVVEGTAWIGCGAIGLPGATGVASNPALNGTWQFLSTPSSSAPVREIVVYSTTVGSPWPYTDFYVDNVSVTSP